MKDDEKNRILAEYAEFVEGDIKKHYYYGIGGDRLPKWEEPGKEWHIKLPNFARSMDACIKWLVPEAIKRFGALDVYYAFCDAMYEAIEKKEFSTEKALYDGKPALAFCLAIEKLIDGGK